MSRRRGQMGANRRSMSRRCTDALRRCGRSTRRLPAGVRRFARLSAAERSTVLRGVAVLLFVEATIRWMRLPRLTRTLGVTFEPQAELGAGVSGGGVALTDSISLKGPAAEGDLTVPVVMARRSVDRLMSVWPLGAGPCLRESLVLGHLIRDRSPVLRVGVARHGPRMRAHAWVEIDGQPVNDPKGFVAFGGPTS
jgi:hypothetical protein